MRVCARDNIYIQSIIPTKPEYVLRQYTQYKIRPRGRVSLCAALKERDSSPGAPNCKNPTPCQLNWASIRLPGPAQQRPLRPLPENTQEIFFLRPHRLKSVSQISEAVPFPALHLLPPALNKVTPMGFSSCGFKRELCRIMRLPFPGPAEYT